MDKTQLIIIGNIIAFIGALFMVFLGFIKDKKKVLILQCVQFLIMGLGNLVLGGLTGLLTNLVSMCRNLWSFKFKYTWPIKIVFILVQAVLALYVNNLGLIGWLPVIAASAFTWFLDIKSDHGLKILIITTQIPWLIYDLFILNFSAATFDILSMVTNTYSLIMILKSVNKDNN